ncbi:PduG protein [Salmonella enterica subsp. enterica serovar Enteritidis str. 6.0562-1]|nr:PduG protein [Salmonella enterica subsp. enterica serovar Enteritidis str. 6.0562-1]
MARQDETGALTITHSALAETTGIKGTLFFSIILI